MANKTAQMVAAHLQGLSPDEVRSFLDKMRQEVEQEREAQQAIKEAERLELANKSIDELTQELQQIGDDPRAHLGRSRVIRDVLDEKIKAAAAQPSTTMDKIDFYELNYKRDQIIQEINKLVASPNRDRKRVQELRDELASLSTPDPDVLTEQPANEGE